MWWRMSVRGKVVAFVLLQMLVLSLYSASTGRGKQSCKCTDIVTPCQQKLKELEAKIYNLVKEHTISTHGKTTIAARKEESHEKKKFKKEKKRITEMAEVNFLPENSKHSSEIGSEVINDLISKLTWQIRILREELVQQGVITKSLASVNSSKHPGGKQDGSRKSDATLNKQHSFTRSLARPKKHELVNNGSKFGELVTIILYQQNNSEHCLNKRRKSLLEAFPKIAVLQAPAKTIGVSFNLLIPNVTTKYFFYLDSDHELFDFQSEHSVGWLLHAMENVPELDFVSGSLLNNVDQLEIPCYRMLLCNWTFAQRYEFYRSIDELMICENIAPSFMGRTSSLNRVFKDSKLAFDEHLPQMAVTDFFLRAKKAGAISGVRPEVMYKVKSSQDCGPIRKTRRQTFLDLLHFARKHKVFRFKDSDSRVLDLCRYDSPIVGEDICDERVAHKVMLGGGHWASDGTFAYPYIIENMQICLSKFTEFLVSKNITYVIDAGIALGAIKMRAVLPWDAGDIDMCAFNINSLKDLNPISREFAQKHGYQFYDREFQIAIFCAPPKGGMNVGGLVTLFKCDGEPPPIVRIKANGKWIHVSRDIFTTMRKYYKLGYLRHAMYGGSHTDPVYCRKKGHNACLPDVRTAGGLDGNAGTFREFFCES